MYMYMYDEKMKNFTCRELLGDKTNHLEGRHNQSLVDGPVILVLPHI